MDMVGSSSQVLALDNWLVLDGDNIDDVDMVDFKGKDGEVNDIDWDDGEVKFLPFAGLITRALMPPLPLISHIHHIHPRIFYADILCIYFCFWFLGLAIRVQNGIIG